jgi:hypothetical protein
MFRPYLEAMHRILISSTSCCIGACNDSGLQGGLAAQKNCSCLCLSMVKPMNPLTCQDRVEVKLTIIHHCGLVASLEHRATKVRRCIVSADNLLNSGDVGAFLQHSDVQRAKEW